MFLLIEKKAKKLIFTLIICFSCCLIVAAEPQTNTPVKQKGIFSNYFEKVKTLGSIYKNKLEIKYFEERLKKTPNDVELLNTYAKFLKDHQAYNEAIKIYKKLIGLTKSETYQKDIEKIIVLNSSQKKDKLFSTYIKQAQKYESQGNIVKANEYYIKAQKIYPERYEVKFGLAKTYCWLNKPKSAIKNYKNLLKQAPKNIDLLEAYAGCLTDNKDYANAREIYKALLDSTKNEKYKTNIQEIILLEKGYTPKQSTAQDKIFLDYIKQAQKYESQGKIAQAKEYYLKAQKRTPNRFEARFGLAKTYGWLKHNKLALSYYKDLLKEFPKNIELIAEYNKFLKENTKYKSPQIKLQQNYAAKTISAENDKSFLAYIKEAQSYEIKGNAQKANEYYLKASKIYPLRYEVKFGLAKTYGWLHKDKLALKYYKELLKNTPNNPDLLEAYANYLKDNKNYAEAMEIYKKLLAQPKNEKYNANIAEIYFLQKDFQTSLKLYSDIYDKNPNNPDIQKSIALLYFVMGDFNKSIDFYQKYFAQKSDQESILNYGKSLFYSKQIQPAKQILENYVNAYPNDIEGLSTLADIYMATKETPKAAELINKGLLIEPNNVKLQIQTAKIDIQAKNYCKAQCLLLKLLAIEPDNTEIIENLGDISFYTNDFNKALGYYQSIPDFNDNKRLVYKIAQSHHYGKNYCVAQNIYRQLLCDPEFSNKSKVGLAEIQISENKPEKAIKILDNVLENDPENIQAKKNLGISYYSMGDNYKSINILKTLPQDDTDVNYNLAKAYNKIERNDVALDLLKNNPQDNAKVLKGELLMQARPAVAPIYEAYYEAPSNGSANAGKYQKAGGAIYLYVKPNLKATITSMAAQYGNITNLVSTTALINTVGLEGQLTDHLGLKTSFGVEPFSNGEAIFLGSALVKYAPNDYMTWTSGYIRSLDEIDSYMSAAGVVPSVGPFANQLVGRIIDNKYILFNIGLKLPHKAYAYGSMNIGNKYGNNSASNFYKEMIWGLGKLLYSAAENKPINQAWLGYDFYYTGYNEDMSGFGGANLDFSPVGSDGGAITPFGGFPGTGGYFSPTFFIANKFPLTFKGTFRETKLKYILSGFIGTQTIQGQVGLLGPSGGPSNIVTTPYFGYSVGLTYNEKGRIGWGFYYTFNNYMSVAQHLLRANLLVRF